MQSLYSLLVIWHLWIRGSANKREQARRRQAVDGGSANLFALWIAHFKKQIVSIIIYKPAKTYQPPALNCLRLTHCPRSNRLTPTLPVKTRHYHSAHAVETEKGCLRNYKDKLNWLGASCLCLPVKIPSILLKSHFSKHDNATGSELLGCLVYSTTFDNYI